ncbi:MULTISPECIES: tetratricopeptide repeat protein [unclassified Herbaspirillum]|uniref:tetratricopeptide repeat protein n=1 Tax=unclassified Herbaspirillum TaxID=2624150 RepID=UPI001151E6B0|nr:MULTISPECIES: tetratricopeptide repeat protein [unclassified Herbaspirillum]MBB5391435.1 tetratricopeptide (TPR) repeat protein [Herbaspirillum sp. SJZ102]TQK12880.1 tetratricopeptide (TPR) repeat protein [Herbaspirillum sp. SJZ130]TQK14884.1 tetratricopeptide (TPR) repeat protein [Herbaspirillum sp. SJZ106]TWC67239.1 tetratricopeptide (TPR) repeat protein [Herbaspirillum sp. SJZ099]
MRQQANAATILLQQALALHQKGQMAPAEALYKKALAKAPGHFEANYLYGMLKLHQEDWDAAEMQLGKAIKLNPRHVDTYFDHAGALEHLGRDQDAVQSYDRVIELKPDFADAFIKRAQVLRRLGRSRDALADCDKAVAIAPDNAEAWFQRGNCQYDQFNFRESQESYKRAVALRPDFIEALFNLGNAHKDFYRFGDALEAYDRALAAAPDFTQAHINRGYVLFRLHRPHEALEAYDRALALDDSSHDLWFNRAATLEELRRFDEAKESYRRAQMLDPATNSARWNEALMQLRQGDFRNGWQQYEARWETRQMQDQRRSFQQPLWLGQESLQGKTILLHAEQGFGDTLQFARYVSVVAAKGAKVILEVQPALERLMRTVPGVSEVVARGGALHRAFDFHCPLMSLPLACQTFSEDAIPRAPYLSTDPGQWAAWHRRLPQNRALRVGLAWSGSSQSTDPSAVAIDAMRSVAFAELAPIVELARSRGGVEFVSLQVGEAAVAQLQAHPLRDRVHDFSAQLTDFSETAALVANLDLVISVDTSVCHLAGALGKPVWLLDRFNGCWRWQVDRTDSPWYQNFTIFRQDTQGDWSGVVAQMQEALTLHLAGE